MVKNVSTIPWATLVVVAVVAVLVSVALVHKFQDRDLSPEEKIEQGVYHDREAINFALAEYDAVLDAGRLMDPASPGLRDLAFLMEAYVAYPNLVLRDEVVPRLQRSYAAVDTAFGTDLTQEQTVYLERIKTASQDAGERDAKDCSAAGSVSKAPNQEPVVNPITYSCD